MSIFGTIFAGLLGLAFGSFLNVCLSRWPGGESFVQPRSHCRNCSHTLAWWENIPLVSWLALRGRCRGCRTWIGLRYPLVELAVGVLWAMVAWPFFQSLAFIDAPAIGIYYALAMVAGHMVFYWLIVALAVLDAENLWLPDWITLPGTALGFIVYLLDFKLTSGFILSKYSSIFYHEAFQRLLAIFSAAALILLIRWVYWLVRRSEGIGLGDAKLMALLAAWLGLPCALLAFGLGVVLGAVVAFVLLAIPTQDEDTDNWALRKLPLGTFLCLGGIVSGLWGQPIIDAYLRWAGL